MEYELEIFSKLTDHLRIRIRRAWFASTPLEVIDQGRRVLSNVAEVNSLTSLLEEQKSVESLE